MEPLQISDRTACVKNSCMFLFVFIGANFVINVSKTYQRILGFGGAFTDAAGINIESLSLKAKENLLRWIFFYDNILLSQLLFVFNYILKIKCMFPNFEGHISQRKELSIPLDVYP